MIDSDLLPNNPGWLRVMADLHEVLGSALGQGPHQAVPNQTTCPIVSFEGICGAGKTTQLTRCQKALESMGLNIAMLELPRYGVTSVSDVLGVLYKSADEFALIEQKLPWLNPALIAVDCREALTALPKGLDAILFSRGLLSSYVYNYPALARALGEHKAAFSMLDRLFEKMPKPNYVFYFELPIEDAHFRVVKRNLNPVRARETVEGLTETKRLFDIFLTEPIFQHTEIICIDARQDVEEITTLLTEKISTIIGTWEGKP